MAGNAIDVYLNDHLAAAMLGSDLAKQIQARSHGTALGQVMESLAPQIEQDRRTLIELMQRLDSSKNPIEQATASIAEKASRAKSQTHALRRPRPAPLSASVRGDAGVGRCEHRTVAR